MTASERAAPLRPRWRSPLAWLFVTLARVWQFLAPARTPRCRFLPTCSQYAITSIRRFGAFRGGWMALRRLLRCHPWNPGGFDPVPGETTTFTT